MTIARQNFADLAVAPDAQCFAIEHSAKPKVGGHRRGFKTRLLPCAMLEVGNVVRNTPCRGHDQSPCQFSWRDWRAHAFSHHYAALGTCTHIDMCTHTASLGNHLEFGQFFNQLPIQVCSLTYEHDYISVFESDGELTNALDRIGVNLCRVSVQFRSTRQFAHCILVVVKDHDIHTNIVPASFYGLLIAP